MPAIEINLERCLGCGSCVTACPCSALTVKNGHAVISDECISCKACVSSCNFKAINIKRALKKDMPKDNFGKDIWILCEHKNGRISEVVFELLGKARELSRQSNCNVVSVLLGKLEENEINKLSAYGSDIVYLVQDSIFNDINDELYSHAFVQIISKYRPNIVLMGATVLGRSIAPRIASILNTGLTADCTELELDGEKNILLQTRPTCGGSLMATVICPCVRPQMATIRPRVMSGIEPDFARKTITIEEQLILPAVKTQVKAIISNIQENPDLSNADIIIAGGRGVGGEKGFALLHDFAGIVGGVVAASRAAVDAGWIEYRRQVGQTGITVKPKVYFSFGISGAIQHLIGMRSSDVIISINKDPNAPIFRYSNYNLIGDIFEILPLLSNEFKKKLA